MLIFLSIHINNDALQRRLVVFLLPVVSGWISKYAAGYQKFFRAYRPIAWCVLACNACERGAMAPAFEPQNEYESSPDRIGVSARKMRDVANARAHVHAIFRFVVRFRVRGKSIIAIEINLERRSPNKSRNSPEAQSLY